MLLDLASRRSESGEYVVCRMDFVFLGREAGGVQIFMDTFFFRTCVCSFGGGERFVLATWQANIRKIVLIFFGRVTGDLSKTRKKCLDPFFSLNTCCSLLPFPPPPLGRP